jgi:DNA-binding NarL/FixJ family response regulator
MTSTERTDDEGLPSIDPTRNPRDLADLVRQLAARNGWRRAASLIEKNWDAFANDAPLQLLAALKALPGEAFVERSGLLVAAGYLQQVTTNGEPAQFVHDGRLAPRTAGTADGELNTLILLTGQTADARTTGRLDEARRIAEQARDALAALSSAERAPMLNSLPHLRFQWGRSLEAADARGAMGEYKSAYELARLTGQPVIARRAAGQLAWHHAEKGRLRQAELWLARAQAEAATNSRYDAIVFLTSALVKHDRGDRTAARDLARALGLPLGELWAAALWVAAMLEDTKPGASFVHGQLEVQLESHPESRSLAGADGRYIKAAQARLARIRPHLRVERALPESPSALDHLLSGVRDYRSRRYREALEHCEAVTTMSTAPRAEAPALLIAAAAHLALGHSGSAASAFRHANAVIGQERLLSAYSFLPPSTVATLSRLAGEPTHIGEHRPGEAALPKLSPREQEVLALLPTGMPLPRIAAELFISPNTLKTTVRSLYRKLGVATRHEAVDLVQRIREG